MTAIETRCSAVEIRTDRADICAPPDDQHDWRAQTVIDQYSPEHQFVGSLLWLNAPQARPLLDLVPDTAIRRPRTRWAYQLIGDLVQAGADPTPAAVLAAGRHQSARDALQPDTPLTADQHKQLALYLFDAYAQAIAPAAAIRSYARAVLEEAYREALHRCGTRMQLLAADGADSDDLAAHFTTIGDELADPRRRAVTAAPPGPGPP
ncbi:MAG TPA: hypothetical protein VMU34_15450 [Mycobacterium sp.]|nr:hypothetical protein [Mycobacterium sp.]